MTLKLSSIDSVRENSIDKMEWSGWSGWPCMHSKEGVGDRGMSGGLGGWLGG